MEKVILCGNANTGKSTVFNKLAKGNARVGNWLGVTCHVTEKNGVLNGRQVVFADLPGMASLHAESDDEMAALTYVHQNNDANFLNVVDINNIRRNLYLLLEMIELGLKIQVVLNFKKSFKGKIDVLKLNNKLGLECVWFGEGLREFKKSSLNVPKTPEGKHALIEKILADCLKRDTHRPYGFSRADKIFLNKFLGVPIFILIAAIIFAVTFLLFPLVFNKPVSAFLKIFEGIFNSKFYDVIIFGTVSTVLSFLPQVVGMLLCLNILENSGYISRLAFLCDDFFEKIGLSGKSVFPMLLSFGCASVAVDFVPTIKNKNTQIKTAAVLSIFPCSAKIPIMLAVFNLLCGKWAFFAVCVMFFACICLALLFAAILNIKTFKTKTEENMILEFPTFKMISPKVVAKNASVSAGDFLARVFGVVLVLQTILFVLTNLKIDFGFMSPIFRPIGFDAPLIVAALLFGVVARELVLTTIFAAGATLSGIFSPAALLAFLVFSLFYSPCASTIAGMHEYFGGKIVTKILWRQFLFAYICAGIVFFIFGGKNFAFLAVVLAAGIMRLLLCKKGCRKCKKCDKLKT